MGQIQVRVCVKCGWPNPPKITLEGRIEQPDKCRNRDCRMMLDRQRVYENILVRTRNLSPHPNYDFGLVNKKKKKIKVRPYFFCRKCEMFFANSAGLAAHEMRRHQ